MQVLYACIGIIGFSILFVFPPHLDLRWSTVVSVTLVALFLAYTERPTQAVGTSVAPLTAVVAASAVLFGHWTIVLVLVALGAVRVRMPGEPRPLRELFSNAYFSQAGAGIIATYCMVYTYGAFAALASTWPHWLHVPVTFAGILLVGMVWQLIQNGMLHVVYAILGRPAHTFQFLRVGMIASLYAYLLVALYNFGGLLAVTLFYVLVAQTRLVEGILGITRGLLRLDQAGNQATSLMGEIMRFTDLPEAEFTREVRSIAQMLARHLGMSRREISRVALAAELHEIGKCRLPARMRHGEGLRSDPTGQLRTYSRLGALMLRSADALVEPAIADYIEYHTEHYDGSGYPRGLRGESIPLESRIITLARSYVCYLTGYDDTPKVQKKEEALQRLRRSSGTLYDPKLVDLLAELVS